MATPKSAAHALERPRHARVACRRCNTRKVKCSGGVPCTNCRQSKVADDCAYPSRAGRVKVKQSYIDDLHTEIESLRQRAHSAISPGGRQALPGDLNPSRVFNNLQNFSCSQLDGDDDVVHEQSNSGPAVEDTIENPVLQDRPWFVPLTPELPLLVSEATDVAFATRLRQVLASETQGHLPRTEFVHHASINLRFSQSESWPWPAPARARFLAKVVFDTICQRYYLVRQSTTRSLLERALKDPLSCDRTSICKLFALFALGEVYSARIHQDVGSFPGLRYYASATTLLTALDEQPRLDCVECLAMLSIYNLAINRRQSSYALIGCSIRYSMIIGLHLNLPLHLMPDAATREHRKRVWWTVYLLDRIWAGVLGQPVSIRNEDIDLQLPKSIIASNGKPDSDFADADYSSASLRIAELSARLSNELYGRRRTRASPFPERVRQALSDLDTWLQALPEPLRHAVDNANSNAPMPVITLYLYFNQCLMLVSRPIVLQRLSLQLRVSAAHGDNVASANTEQATPLVEACNQCARRCYHILADCWVRGSFPTFDFTYSQCLFSAAVVLAMSSVSDRHGSQEQQDDAGFFEDAVDILRQLQDSGSYAATELHKHAVALKSVTTSLAGTQMQRLGRYDPLDEASLRPASEPQVQDSVPQTATNPWSLPAAASASLETLLSQPDLDLQSLETPFYGDDFETFFWPDLVQPTTVDGV